MTLRQVRLLYRAIERDNRADRADRIIDINAGHHGGDTAKKLLNTLRS